MRSIFLIGAGRSSASLIEYLLKHAASDDYRLTIGDVSEDSAREKSGGHPAARPIRFDINDVRLRDEEIAHADLVISLLPAHMHVPVAEACVRFGKHLVTASYVSPEMQALDTAARQAGVLLLNECGLDPGIDHMSAMEVIDGIRKSDGELLAFRSYTGGLVAPESNDNPWGYKFSWNPRNVILAGQGTARYIERGNYKYIPYQRLFRQIRKVTVNGVGAFDGYANRDSLSYRKVYGIENIPTMIRGTLRQEGYCTAWDVFVRLGLTDDSYILEHSVRLTYAELVEALLPDGLPGIDLAEQVATLCGLDSRSREMEMVRWTGIFEPVTIGLHHATPAQALQQLLEKRWVLGPADKDMIVMQHEFEYRADGQAWRQTSSLVVTGKDNRYTAMAQTVGLPVAIAARRILSGEMTLTGVHVPVSPVIYGPVLRELETLGIRFTEHRERMNAG
jgi:saccharopine dehydrogenase-like NADP-dependent oxidoreductase